MLKNAYLFAKIGTDTAENERDFAKKMATTLPVVPTLRARRCEVVDW